MPRASQAIKPVSRHPVGHEERLAEVLATGLPKGVTPPRRHTRRGLVCASVLATVLTGVALSGPGTAGAAELTQLSDRHTLSRWAYPTAEARVRVSPSAGAHAIGRLRFLTSDDQAQLYLTAVSATLASQRTWVEIELPGRPNGRTGWVPRSALGPLHVAQGYLAIDRSRFRATLYRAGRAIFSAPIGVGKAGTITPSGTFYVVEKLTTRNDPTYGPYAIGTSAYAPTLSEWPGGGVVGIHGTDEPWLIPGRPSHGCIRMRNADIARLWPLIAPGTPIEIT